MADGLAIPARSVKHLESAQLKSFSEVEPLRLVEQ